MSETVRTAAISQATRLCDRALGVLARTGASPAVVARVKRYQVEEFDATRSRTERLVCDLPRAAPGEPVSVRSRDELLAAVGLYCATGIAEIERRFA